jgi:hypothetical protein
MLLKFKREIQNFLKIYIYLPLISRLLPEVQCTESSTAFVKCTCEYGHASYVYPH